MRITKLFLLVIAVHALWFGDWINTQSHTAVWAAPTVPQPRTSAPVERRKNDGQEQIPRVIFLNQRAVLIASKENREKYREHQDQLIDMINNGVTVLICPDCMKQYGIKAVDLIDGVQIGKPGQVLQS